MAGPGAGARRGGEARPVWHVAAACLCVQLCFGAYPVIVQVSTDKVPFNLACFCLYRDLAVAPLMLAAARVAEGVALRPRADEVPTFAVLGACGIGVQQICFILGAHYASPTVASIMQNATPCWATLFSIALRNEPAPDYRRASGLLKLAGMALAVGGAVAMNLGRREQHAPEQLGGASTQSLGVAFLAVNTALTGFYLAFQKRAVFAARESRWRDLPVHVTAWAYAFGAAFAGATALLGWLFELELLEFAHGSPTATWRLPRQALLPLAFAVFFTSGLAWGLLSFANKNAPSSLVSAFWPLQVPVTLLLSAAAGLGTITAPEALGGVLVVAGLLAVSASALLAPQAATTATTTTTRTRADSEAGPPVGLAADDAAEATPLLSSSLPPS
jgi:drug/metabolite transporter (DMT)-like permease